MVNTFLHSAGWDGSNGVPDARSVRIARGPVGGRPLQGPPVTLLQQQRLGLFEVYLVMLTNWAASAPVPSAARCCHHSPSTPDSETTYISGSSLRDNDHEIIRWYSISSSRIVMTRPASRLPDQSFFFRRSPISVTTVAWFCMTGTSDQLV